jgi:tungstate transport system substrate-binding protein
MFAAASCAGKQKISNQENASQENTVVVLSTTTSTKDSGLLDKLLPVFEQKTGYKVKVISQGTGQALKTGELGDCDVVLVHSRAAEDKFVADGFGVNRRDVMYNDFVIVGPENDPAGIKGKSAVESFKTLAQAQKYEFLSRGDDSGTHKKEKELWEKASIKPEGKWYLPVGKGMGDTLIMASEKGGYTLADRGTYASMMDRLKLSVLVQGDQLLLNPYGVIAVNPQKHPQINYKGAMAFIEFITSKEGKDIINSYVVNGQQLFYAQ